MGKLKSAEPDDAAAETNRRAIKTKIAYVVRALIGLI